MDRDRTARTAARIFDGVGATDEPFTLHLRGTNFQLQVWQALLRIPAGHAVSYSDLARAIDRPTATRAVANAIGANPVAYVIPCHRVLRESGELGGYRWDPVRKQAMLVREATVTASS